MVVSAPREIGAPDQYSLPRYNESARRDFDLLHTKLDVRFDWPNEKVLGKATLKLAPYFYATDELVLDAKNFEFHEVRFAQSKQLLQYDYDGKKITIQLGKEYTRKDTITIIIDYTATPAGEGGSAAITSDKGLYFINPRNEDPDKPQQIWTQGETESNSRWFPTIDKPNERTTQEIYVTVEDRFTTLSNGILMSSKKNSDGTRTDYWKMDLPHAPYLFMLAIGEYAVVKESWRGKPVEYYVEPKFEKDAKAIFPHTPEMLSLFSDQLGVEYPWPKYSQVVVRDYVSGAMENTSAVIFGEFMQKTADELADDDDINEKVVAHEMFHHWFGDLVTCESWSNLTLNEGFANYSEYLWMEHKYGADEADYHWLGELKGYLGSSKDYIHDLIDFKFEDKEDMFDAHSYNKGGLILHMLRREVGDEAFFAALNRYLSKNAFTDVEAHELRLVFEDVTGRDLNWFFNQWFFDKGQPQIAVDYEYDADQKMVKVTVEQLQNPEKMPAIFQLPAAIDIFLSPNSVIREKVMVNQRKQTFTFPAESEPKLVNFDADKALLCEKQENKTAENYRFQYENGRKMMDRYEALDALSYVEGELSTKVFAKALDDPFWALRFKAMQKVDLKDAVVLQKIAKMAQSDPKPHVRAESLIKLSESGDATYATLIKSVLEKDKSLVVRGSALKALQVFDTKAATQYAAKMEMEESEELLQAIGELYLEQGDASKLAFYEKTWDKFSSYSVITFIGNYAELAGKNSEEVMMTAADKLKAIAVDMNSTAWKRFAATNGINLLHVEMAKRAGMPENKQKSEALRTQDEQLKSMIRDIKNAETNNQLKMYYSNFPTQGVKP